MSGRNAEDFQAGSPRLGGGLGTESDDRYARPGCRKRPGGGAGHEERDVGVRHLGPELDRPVERNEVGVEDAPPGELILYEDSYGLVTVAISRGNAARLTGVAPGDELRIAVA